MKYFTNVYICDKTDNVISSASHYKGNSFKHYHAQKK